MQTNKDMDDILKLKTLFSRLPFIFHDGDTCSECFQKSYDKYNILEKAINLSKTNVDDLDLDYLVGLYMESIKLIELTCKESCNDELYEPFHEIFNRFKQYLDTIPYQEYNDDSYDPLVILDTSHVSTQNSLKKTVFLFLMLLFYVTMVLARIITHNYYELEKQFPVNYDFPYSRQITSGDEFKQLTLYIGDLIAPYDDMRRYYEKKLFPLGTKIDENALYFVRY